MTREYLTHVLERKMRQEEPRKTTLRKELSALHAQIDELTSRLAELVGPISEGERIGQPIGCALDDLEAQLCAARERMGDIIRAVVRAMGRI